MNIQFTYQERSGNIVMIYNNQRYTIGLSADFNAVYGIAYPGVHYFEFINEPGRARKFYNKIKKELDYFMLNNLEITII